MQRMRMRLMRLGFPTLGRLGREKFCKFKIQNGFYQKLLRVILFRR
jgi:hypothetical protein